MGLRKASPRKDAYSLPQKGFFSTRPQAHIFVGDGGTKEIKAGQTTLSDHPAVNSKTLN